MAAQTLAKFGETGDDFKASRLERMLSNFTASYKLFFLKAIFDEVIGGATYASFDLLAARMVASAWYPVLFFRLNLGATDQLTKVVNLAHDLGELHRTSSEKDIVAGLLSTDSKQLRKALRSLTNYVPYRLIRPFYSDRLARERKLLGRIPDGRTNDLIMRFNHEDIAGAPYTLEYDGSGVVIDEGWAKYFRENSLVVRGWFDMRLVQYLQARNPSVPAIPLKIYPPIQRDLSKARAWWTDAIRTTPMREVYTHRSFDAKGFSDHGPLSIDHFVPWSFVLHDEPWNLIPTFRDTNSSKGSRLPSLDKHLDAFCSQQMQAILTQRKDPKHKSIMEAYATVDSHVREYEDSERSFDAFSRSLSRVIVPLHQIAANQGFPLWEGMCA